MAVRSANSHPSGTGNNHDRSTCTHYPVFVSFVLLRDLRVTLFSDRQMSLPYLTRNFPGIGGAIKQRAEDFFVQEIPLYEPSGAGEHVYCEIQKVGIPTFEAINRIAEALHVSTRDIGYAGLKDARAISRQVLSILGTTEQAVMDLHLPDITVQWAARHGNKLRLGHLAGNRFAIKIRNVNPTDVVKLRPVLDVMERRGVPNFFGEQRFGRRGDNDVLGACLIRGRPEELLHHLLGAPNPDADDPESLLARQQFDQGNYEQSMKHWPRRSGMERRILARLMKTQKAGAAVRAIDQRLRRLWVSALQSRLFNDVLAQRIDSIDRLMDGDVAYKHDNGACFRVESAADEQPRCDAFEISPTGPIVGHRVTMPLFEPLRIEQAVLKSHGLTPGHFKQEGRDQAKGARRALRVKPTETRLEAGVDDHGAFITASFVLPAGSFATVLLRELMKSDRPEAPPPSDEHE
jgi:tRNA pseudouridine13 synthase